MVVSIDPLKHTSPPIARCRERWVPSLSPPRAERDFNP